MICFVFSFGNAPKQCSSADPEKDRNAASRNLKRIQRAKEQKPTQSPQKRRKRRCDTGKKRADSQAINEEACERSKQNKPPDPTVIPNVCEEYDPHDRNNAKQNVPQKAQHKKERPTPARLFGRRVETMGKHPYKESQKPLRHYNFSLSEDQPEKAKKLIQKSENNAPDKRLYGESQQ